jgi:hypothetical protein
MPLRDGTMRVDVYNDPDRQSKTVSGRWNARPGEKVGMEGERDAFPGNLALARPLGGRGEQLGENAPPNVASPARFGAPVLIKSSASGDTGWELRVDVGLIFGADEKRLCLSRQRHWTSCAQ